MVTTMPPVIDYPEDHKPPRRRREWLEAVGIGVALVASTAALAISLRPTAHTTSTAHTTPAPVVFSQQDIAQARTEAACAVKHADDVMTLQRGPLVDALVSSPVPIEQTRDLIAQDQAGTVAAVNNIREHLRPALPADLLADTNDYMAAMIAVAAGDARMLYFHSEAELAETNKASARATAALGRITPLCPR